MVFHKTNVHQTMSAVNMMIIVNSEDVNSGPTIKDNTRAAKT